MELLDLVFPKTCLLCGREGKYICEECLGKVRLAKSICPYCEKPSIDGVAHTRCMKKLGLDGLTSVWEYDGIVRKAILALKYKYSTEVGQELANLFLKYLSGRLLPSVSCLAPIPIYWYRQNVRGFNQSIQIGKLVAAQMGWKFMPDLLIKKKSTTSQVELSGDKRRQNLKGVFSLNPSYSLLANNYSLILFDDVFTTGSTLSEACKILKRAGATKVWGLTIAR